MPKDTTIKELLALHRSRLKDRAQFSTRRRKQGLASPRRFSEVLLGLFADNGQAMQKISEGQALLAWESFVGEAAGRVSQALRIRSQTLTVKVTDPLWMQQLSLCKHDLIRKYREAFPRLSIRDIYFTRY